MAETAKELTENIRTSRNPERETDETNSNTKLRPCVCLVGRHPPGLNLHIKPVNQNHHHRVLKPRGALHMEDSYINGTLNRR